MYDVTTAISKGQREYQEDAVVADFNLGNPFGFAVLADGMGGHAAGDVASKIVVTEVFSELKFQFGEPESLEKDIATVLQDVARSANDCISAHVDENPGHQGMGATLVAPIIFEKRLYWISIGDSPLYLFRKGALTQLNEDHSMAPQIDVMVKTGQIDEETARNHPDRNCLTSVLMGDRIPKIDCRVEPTTLQTGDILVVASDGLQFLTDKQIQSTINRAKRKSSAQIAEALLSAVYKLKDPDQDNISFTVLKVS
ncbi:protein phosphatase 2C domain-containing protein [Parasulfitobacter algicola]|uniref:Serine/threonine-protein phosphatase n=1 Tax=Parasulfitobacter algicola TaxID=2614809 RepID=A0ABX2IT86_9RHOB|nr:serine/threonine-protein phosphatase [Sulfitobacter algicola]